LGLRNPPSFRGR